MVARAHLRGKPHANLLKAEEYFSWFNDAHEFGILVPIYKASMRTPRSRKSMIAERMVYTQWMETTT